MQVFQYKGDTLSTVQLCFWHDTLIECAAGMLLDEMGGCMASLFKDEYGSSGLQVLIQSGALGVADLLCMMRHMVHDLEADSAEALNVMPRIAVLHTLVKKLEPLCVRPVLDQHACAEHEIKS